MEIQMWKEILTPYDLAVEELQVKFNHPERPIIESQRQWGVLDQGLLIKCYAVYRAILIQSQGKLDLSVWRSQPHAFIRI